ncbi:MAG TPA: DHH family phosphoesterase [Oscillospiraceae bacterium]|mgnify:CR=1 FL=1|nr:DHH family phosphoesterase [Oscillospiraceae bacterium]
MKGRSWLVLKLTGIALIITALSSAIIINKIDSFLTWTMLFVTSVLSLALVTELIAAERNTHRFIARMDSTINSTEKESLYNFPAPAIIIDETMSIIWYNKAFSSQMYNNEDAFGIRLDKIFRLDPEKPLTSKGTIVEYGLKSYKISVSDIRKYDAALTMIYFEDVTNLVALENKYAQTRPSVILIMVDNYDDVLQNVKESEKANVLVQLEKLFESFIDSSAGLIRKTSKDRFFAVVEEKYLNDMISEKFKILDKARTITVNEKLAVTLSIGVGHGGKTISESEAFAKQALDMALGRGGDQAAVKTENGFEFFGGVSKGIEKHAKVKTRIIATALLEMIQNSECIYIMGHRFGDLDSIGAAVGLGGAVHNIGKNVKVVVEPEKNLATNLITRIKEEENENFFITPEMAVSEFNEQDLLVIVDTHNKQLVESPELYKKAKHIVVIDHHRKTVNYIDNAVIFHHEPYASSASEMVSELIQYFGNIGKFSSYYAEALLAGIMLDTKSFVMRTGVRTFEAAAFLRKLGADTVAVRGLFANSIDSYQKKTRLVSTAEIYNHCAITISDIQSEDIRVIAPQAADELLGISGVDASFVIYDNDGTICFSARSLGAMNVQIIMEKLGGGGHQTMAGAQMKDLTLEGARQALLEAIDQHLKEIN